MAAHLIAFPIGAGDVVLMAAAVWTMVRAKTDVGAMCAFGVAVWACMVAVMIAGVAL